MNRGPSPRPPRAGHFARGLSLGLVCLAACGPPREADLVHIPALPVPVARPAPSPPVVAREPRPSAPAAPEPAGRKKGSKVWVEWHGTPYAATVLGTTSDGKTRIHYDGYGDEWDEDVTEDRISNEGPDDVDF